MSQKGAKNSSRRLSGDDSFAKINFVWSEQGKKFATPPILLTAMAIRVGFIFEIMTYTSKIKKLKVDQNCPFSNFYPFFEKSAPL